MAATGRVQYVITGEASGMSSTLDDVTKRAEKLEQQVGRLTEKLREKGKTGTDAFSALSSGAGNFFASLAGGFTVLGTLKSLLDDIKARQEGVRAEQDRSLNSARNYIGAFGQISMTLPGASAGQLQGINTEIQRLAESRALGSGGPAALASTYATIHGASPTAPQAAKLDALAQVAKTLELSPRENPNAVGLGVAKMMEQSGFEFSGTQALNILRKGQDLSMTESLGSFSEAIPKLGAVSRLGGIGIRDSLALFSLFTQQMGDKTGEESATAIMSMTANLMTRSSDLAERSGIPEDELKGNLFERFGAFRRRYQAGQISEAQMGDIFPVISKGGGGKMSAYELLNGGWQQLGNYVGEMNDPRLMNGDLTQQDIATLQNVLPGMKSTSALARQESSIDMGRTRRSLDDVTLKKMVRNELERMGVEQGAADFGVLNFEQAREGRMDPARAFVNAIRSGRMSNSAGGFVRGITTPLLQYGDSTLYGGAGAVNDSEISDFSPGTVQIVRELQKQTQELTRQNNKPPNRPLPSNLNN